jgi:hypothetical protein
MKTVTYDETKWKLVPIEPSDAMAIAAVKVSLRNPAINGVPQYIAMIAAAPPYPEDSPEKDLRDFGQCWAKVEFKDGNIVRTNISMKDILLPLPAAPYPEDQSEQVLDMVNANLVSAALGVLRDIEHTYKPPIPEFIPCGKMVYVRLSALAELHKVVYGKYAEEGDSNYMYAHSLAAPKGE